MRLFIALRFPDRLRNRIYEAAEPLRAAEPPVRWVDPAQLHLTLQFLGEVEAARAEAWSAALEEVAARHAPFGLPLGGVGGFPSLRSPRVIWLGVPEPPEALAALQSAVVEASAGLGVEPEKRPFHAHVTLGRTRRRLRSEEGEALRRAAEEVSLRAEHEVGSVVLMRSRLGRGGARYEPVTLHELAAAGDTE